MRFCRASKQKPSPISNRKRCRLSRMDCSKSFSVTNARSFNPKNSKVTGVLITSLGCNKVACCWTKGRVLFCFWIVRYVRNIKMLFVVPTQQPRIVSISQKARFTGFSIPDMVFKWVEDNLLNNLSAGIIHVSVCRGSVENFQMPFSDSAVNHCRI